MDRSCFVRLLAAALAVAGAAFWPAPSFGQECGGRPRVFEGFRPRIFQGPQVYTPQGNFAPRFERFGRPFVQFNVGGCSGNPGGFYAAPPPFSFEGPGYRFAEGRPFGGEGFPPWGARDYWPGLELSAFQGGRY